MVWFEFLWSLWSYWQLIIFKWNISLRYLLVLKRSLMLNCRMWCFENWDVLKGIQKYWLPYPGNSILRCFVVEWLHDISIYSYTPLFHILNVVSFPFVFLSSQLKKKMQILTLAIGGVGLLSAYVSYSPEVAARFVLC